MKKDIMAFDDSIKVIMYSSEQQEGEALKYIKAQTLDFIIKDNQAFSKIDQVILKSA